MTRKARSVLLLAVGMLIGYAVRPVPAVAQGDFHPFMTGQAVRLTVDGFPAGVTTITCNLLSVSNDFVHCAADGQHRARAVNLRYVQEITPQPER